MSYDHFYRNRDDFEVLIVEDSKNAKDSTEHQKLLDIINKFNELNIKHLISWYDDCYNPAPSFNFAARASLGEFLVITNPECMHSVDILTGFDSHFSIDRNLYVVCACQDVSWSGSHIEDFSSFKCTFIEWYQHTQRNSRLLHFCSAISKENFNAIAGFDEEFKKGIAYEDNDFINRVKRNKIQVIGDDNLLVYHLSHGREYQSDRDLIDINRKLYVSKWG
jgi:hypothetical protein